MRSLTFTILGVGFLFLIALSWHAKENDTHVFPESTPIGATNRGPASSLPESRAKILSLSHCLENNSCEGLRLDSENSLANALAMHLANYGADAELARSALESDAPLAQIAGLRMLAALPPSGESLSALGNGVRHTTNMLFIEGTVHELERYLGTTYETEAQRIVEHLVGYGDGSSGTRAAALVGPFINEHSYEEFRELLPRIDRSVGTAKLLKSALEAYEHKG
jgi:hypothetical protein